MRMIYVGTLDAAPDRDSGWIDAFRDLGVQVSSYSSTPQDEPAGLVGKVLKRFHLGLANRLMQDNLIELVEREKPDWVHFRLPVEFDRSTIIEIKKKGVALTQYFNDDPFSRIAPVGFHWKFRHALAAYDGHFVYRLHNVDSYLRAGAVHVEHCPPSYDPRRHRRIHTTPAEARFLADAAFVGHWENDWRVACLDALVRNGFDVILKGGSWNRAIRGRAIGKLAPITHAFGEEYNRIYAGVSAGLCFFSKINRDTWTRRALEIVAVGGLLVCERTDEAQSYFRDREEAYFFSSIEELIAIVGELKAHPAIRERVRAAGYEKLVSKPNTIDDRAAQIIRYVTSVRNGLGSKSF
jgi:spore maturation protein CgeB